MRLPLVKGRDCGDCSACCVSLRINENNLKKDADTPCQHLGKKGGCSIYEQRPSVCINWFCAWRHMRNIGDEWRPDRSGIIIRFDEQGFILQPTRDPLETLTSELCLGLVASCVSKNISISISVPTKEGFCYSLVRINEPLQKAIATSNLFTVKLEMLNFIRFASSLQTDPIQPITS